MKLLKTPIDGPNFHKLYEITARNCSQRTFNELLENFILGNVESKKDVLNFKDKNGDTVLHRAARDGKYHIVRFFARHQNLFKINEINKKDETPLDCAKKKSVIDLLTSFGAGKSKIPDTLPM